MKFPSGSHFSCHVGVVGLSTTRCPGPVKRPLALGRQRTERKNVRSLSRRCGACGGDGNRAIQCQGGIARGVRRGDDWGCGGAISDLQGKLTWNIDLQWCRSTRPVWVWYFDRTLRVERAPLRCRGVGDSVPTSSLSSDSRHGIARSVAFTESERHPHLPDDCRTFITVFTTAGHRSTFSPSTLGSPKRSLSFRFLCKVCVCAFLMSCHSSWSSVRSAIP
jgi:hypothetical protein